MEIQDRLFSEYDGETFYSVGMNEEEYTLYSEFCEQRLYMMNHSTGEFYTGKDLLNEAREIRSKHRNGTIKTYYENGKLVKDDLGKKIDRSKSIREAYINKNLAMSGESVKKLDKANKKALSYLERNGLVRDIKALPKGGHSFVISDASKSFNSKVKDLGKKLNTTETRNAIKGVGKGIEKFAKGLSKFIR